MVLFAPLATLFLRVISGADAEVSYETVAKSVGVFLGIPLGAATAAGTPIYFSFYYYKSKSPAPNLYSLCRGNLLSLLLHLLFPLAIPITKQSKVWPH
jgi:hypothetical protein